MHCDAQGQSGSSSCGVVIVCIYFSVEIIKEEERLVKTQNPDYVDEDIDKCLLTE